MIEATSRHYQPLVKMIRPDKPWKNSRKLLLMGLENTIVAGLHFVKSPLFVFSVIFGSKMPLACEVLWTSHVAMRFTNALLLFQQKAGYLLGWFLNQQTHVNDLLKF